MVYAFYYRTSYLKDVLPTPIPDKTEGGPVAVGWRPSASPRCGTPGTSSSREEHALARDVFHGKRGELYQRYREGQEDQLRALGLVVNMIVFRNTLYMDAVLDQLRSEGFQVRPEDEARLSPFGHEHINMLGRYSFAVPEAVTRGELRPLRVATDA